MRLMTCSWDFGCFWAAAMRSKTTRRAAGFTQVESTGDSTAAGGSKVYQCDALKSRGIQTFHAEGKEEQATVDEVAGRSKKRMRTESDGG